jgi:hypothetical protein
METRCGAAQHWASREAQALRNWYRTVAVPVMRYNFLLFLKLCVIYPVMRLFALLPNIFFRMVEVASKAVVLVGWVEVTQ